MTGNRRDFVRRASSFRKPDRRSFAQPMKGTMVKVRHVALFAEPIAKARRSEWLVKLSDKKRQMPARCRLDCPAKICMHWNSQLCAGAPLGFSSDPVQQSFADVLRPHAHDILTGLPGIESKSKRKPWLRS